MKAKVAEFLRLVYDIPPHGLWVLPGALTYVLISITLLANILFKSSHLEGQAIVVSIGQFEIVGIVIYTILSLSIWKFLFWEADPGTLIWIHFTISIVFLAFFSVFVSADPNFLRTLSEVVSLAVGMIVFVIVSANISFAFYSIEEEKSKRHDG